MKELKQPKVVAHGGEGFHEARCTRCNAHLGLYSGACATMCSKCGLPNYVGMEMVTCSCGRPLAMVCEGTVLARTCPGCGIHCVVAS